ncbi:hypothetical protein G4G28_12525 [Massilia sp. Dwa41.01b]|nr:hypothetical protein [Massilia sp. Dwa41.01b]QNA87224.1 hypothetical protein G4G28_12525 [Massilia sp. Dwa41.01b]
MRRAQFGIQAFAFLAGLAARAVVGEGQYGAGRARAVGHRMQRKPHRQRAAVAPQEACLVFAQRGAGAHRLRQPVALAGSAQLRRNVAPDHLGRRMAEQCRT